MSGGEFTALSLDEAVNRMWTCATAARCAREEACFVVVRELQRRLDAERLERELTAAAETAAQADTVSGYAPGWETSGPPGWPEPEADPDWSAA